jgi:hypothetical protein
MATPSTAYRESYGNYDGSASHKTFSGEQQHARKCTVDALEQKVRGLEQQMAKDYPLQCDRCPNQSVDCTQAQDPNHCTELQNQCRQKGCYTQN